MITVLNENKLPKWQISVVHDAIGIAIRFIKNKYNINPFELDCSIVVSNSCRGSSYYRSNKLIKLAGRRRSWHTYKRKRVGLCANGIYVGIKERYILSLIQELTHHIQNIQKRKASEVETTKNEIEYVKQFHPYLAKQLTTIQ